ncbi:MAG: metallophosphoesterase [Persicimonas sp.]
MVEAIDRADPQLVAITGDLIDNRTDLADADELCRQISRSGRNVVATLGNWEHRSGHDIEDVAKLYKTCDIELLVNDSMQLDDGLIVAGTDDGATGRADLPATVRALPDGDVKLLLTHAPGLLDVLLDVGTTFDLTLSGHTHGGQVKFGPFAPMRPAGSGPFVSGMYDTSIGPAYVSRGVGTTLLPVRFFCRPELAIFELRR